MDGDSTADGQFVYAVKTTGVYCRPSCRSRLPNVANVEFFSTAEVAEKSGFRACKRCKPKDVVSRSDRSVKLAELCRFIEQSSEMQTLKALAKKCGLSPFHLQRVFKAETGLTPRGYAVAWRATELRAQLPKSRSVTEALYAAGFNSSGRFYATAKGMLGMKPSSYKNGGAMTELHFATANCSLGVVLVAASQRGICAVFLGDQAGRLSTDLSRRFPKASIQPGGAELRQLVAQVVKVIESRASASTLPLDIRGTIFQEKVWQALRNVPVGTTATYAEIAERISQPKAFRAVAQACGANPVAVIVPCHRVVRTDGHLSGYRWGIERKRALLEREAAAAPCNFKKGYRRV